MSSYAQVRRTLSWTSVLARFLLVSYLVFATYNPSNYSLLTWILSGVSNWSVRLFLLFSLGLAWLIILRLSFQGLGRLGAFFIACALFLLFLTEARFGFLADLPRFQLLIVVELLVAVFITFGLVLSYWVRQASGQSPIVKHPP